MSVVASDSVAVGDPLVITVREGFADSCERFRDIKVEIDDSAKTIRFTVVKERQRMPWSVCLPMVYFAEKPVTVTFRKAGRYVNLQNPNQAILVYEKPSPLPTP
jgi:hypothetical protein